MTRCTRIGTKLKQLADQFPLPFSLFLGTVGAFCEWMGKVKGNGK